MKNMKKNKLLLVVVPLMLCLQPNVAVAQGETLVDGVAAVVGKNIIIQCVKRGS